MTNTYNICGKGTCADPPVYLKYAIRKAYPLEREDECTKYLYRGLTNILAKVRVRRNRIWVELDWNIRLTLYHYIQSLKDTRSNCVWRLAGFIPIRSAKYIVSMSISQCSMFGRLVSGGILQLFDRCPSCLQTRHVDTFLGALDFTHSVSKTLPLQCNLRASTFPIMWSLDSFAKIRDCL